jgi:CHAT domain-containing protein
MDEQRVQAYMGLIKALLACPSGQEVLYTTPEMLDVGLVEVMKHYADYLECCQEDSNAARLRHFATQLAQSLRLDQDVLSRSSSVNAARFVFEVMNLIAQTQCNQIKVYELFRANLDRLDESLQLILPIVFEDLMQANDPSLVAAGFGDFSSLIRQFPWGNRMLNLELAITASRLALQIRTREAFPEDWAMTLRNLGHVYAERIRGERAENLEKAIEALEFALQVRTCERFPEQWARTQSSLSGFYYHRIRGKREENLGQAIKSAKLALQILTYENEAFRESWAITQNNLAIAYTEMMGEKREENLEQAIKSAKLALQVFTYENETFRELWAGVQHNLAIAYAEQKNLEQAIEAWESALKVRTREAFPEQWAATHSNLALACTKSIGEQNTGSRERAISSYKLALQVYTCEAFPKDCRNTAQNLGNLYFQEKSWIEARDAYIAATAATESLYQSSISYNGKGDELKAAADIPSRLAYAQTQLGNFQAAILTLEQGRACGLTESLNRDRNNLTQLENLAPKLHNTYQDITQQLRNLESQDRNRMVSDNRDRVPEDLINTTKKLRQALAAKIDQIRQVPGYEDFLTPTKWEDITIALSSDSPLLYLVTTPNGSVALIVTPDNIEAIWSNFSETQLRELVQIWFDAYNQQQDDRLTWLNTIDTTTRQLWDCLMGPIVQHLKTLGYDRATLIPTGYLSLLPLHAAWTEDPTRPTGRSYALDDIHFTYAPNARSLTAAREIVDRPFTQSILAIDNPRNNLPNSQREIDCAIDTFIDRTVLRHDAATIEAVKAGLVAASIVHFSCHGTANFDTPLNSGLLMSNGLLTLKDLLARNLSDSGGIRLAILSACETGLPGLDNIDEVVSLPVGLMQAGVAGVIASLWSVSDLSSMMLLTRFYDLWRKGGREPAIALHQAQQWMHSTTDGEKADYCGLVITKSQRDQRTYAHPFHWAAFSYLGL